MTLKNEIFEGLGAATAAKKLVYDPLDDYREQLAKTAAYENEIHDEMKRKRKEDIAKGIPPSYPGYLAPGVPTAASTATPVQPTVPGQPPAQPTATNPRNPPPAAAVVPPAVAPNQQALIPSLPPIPNPLYAARGGRIKKPRRVSTRAIRTGYRAGGAVTPRNDPYDDFMTRSPYTREPYRPEDYGALRQQSPEGEDADWERQQRGQVQSDTYDYSRPKWDEDEDEEETMQPYEPREEREPWDSETHTRGGPYERTLRFQAGGNVDDPTDPMGGELDLPPVDQLVLGMLKAHGGSAAQRINQSVGEPWQVPGAGSEWHGEGTAERARQLAATRAAQARDTQAIVTSAPPVEPSTRAGRVLNTIHEFVSPPGSGGEYARRQRELEELRAAREKIPGILSTSTEPEIAQAKAEADAAQRAQAERTTDPIEVPTVPRAVARAFEVPTSPAPLGAGAGTVDAGQQQAAAEANKPKGPTGTATPPAPPAGAGAANAPSTAPKGAPPGSPTAMRPDLPNWDPLGVPAEALRAPPPPAARPAAPAGGGGGGGGGGGTGGGGTAVTTAPPPRLGMSDPNRTAAFDPTAGGADMTDPTRRRTELSEMLIGAATQARPHAVNGGPPPVGQGAVSNSVGQTYVQYHSQGGRYEPGEAIMRGMLSDYKVLLSYGKIEQANRMAYGLIQYANLEAASHAHVAEDLVKRGDFLGALRNVVAAAGYLPDGMNHAVGPDGKSVVTTDANGKVTATTPVDGRWLLAAIGGFKDGNMLWQTLNAAAQQLQKPDKTAEQRRLGQEIQRNTIKLQQQRLAKGANPGARGPAPISETEKEMRRIRAQISGLPPPTEPTPGAPVAQGDADADPATAYNPGYPTEEPEPS